MDTILKAAKDLTYGERIAVTTQIPKAVNGTFKLVPVEEAWEVKAVHLMEIAGIELIRLQLTRPGTSRWLTRHYRQDRELDVIQ